LHSGHECHQQKRKKAKEHPLGQYVFAGSWPPPFSLCNEGFCGLLESEKHRLPPN
jgi:hypothetical protein